MAAQNLAVNVLIGASLSGTFGAAFASAKATMGSLGATAKGLGLQQKALGASIEKYATTLSPLTLAGMHRDYQRLGALMEEAKLKQNALNQALQRGAALRMQRADLLSQAAGTLATGAVLAAPVTLSVNIAGDFQAQMRDIAITGRLSAQEEAQVADTVRENAKTWGLAHRQIGEGVQALVAGGIQSAQDLTAYTPSIAKAAVASNAAVGDVATTFLAFRDNLKIGAADAASAFSMLAYAGKEGRFEVKEMARWLPALAPQLAGMGVYGKQAIAELGAALQVARTGAGTPDEAANNLRNFLNKIMSPDTAKDFKKAGIDLQSTLKASAQHGLSPMEGMMDTITRYIEKKAPQAGEAFKQALAIGDIDKRSAALDAIEQQFKLGTLFQDQQAMGFIRAMLLQREMYANIRRGAMAEGGQPAGQMTIDQDAAARMATFNNEMGRFKTQVADLGISIGAALLPALNSLVAAVTPVVAAFGQFAAAHPNVIKNTVGLVAGLLGMKLALLGGGLAVNLIKTPFAALGTLFATVSAKWTLLKAALQFGNLASLGAAFARIGAAVKTFAGVLGGALVTGLRAAGTAFMVLGLALLAFVMTPVGATITALAIGALLIYKNWNKIAPLFAKAAAACREAFDQMMAGARAAGDAIVQGFNKVKEVPGLIKAALGAALAYLRGLVGQFFAAGVAIIGGLVRGIQSKIAAAKAAIANLGAALKSTITGALGIQSPSTVFAGYGAMIGAGLTQGLAGAAPAVAAAMRRVSGALTLTPPTVQIATPPRGGNVIPFVAPSTAPLSRTRKDADAAAGQAGTILYFNPTIHIKGETKDADKIKKHVQDALKLSLRDFERVAGQAAHQSHRTGYR